MSKKKVFILSGEASGDLHAANLVRAWKKNSSDFEFQAWGGDRLSAEGVELKVEYSFVYNSEGKVILHHSSMPYSK